jgi:hypothetical protein
MDIKSYKELYAMKNTIDLRRYRILTLESVQDRIKLYKNINHTDPKLIRLTMSQLLALYEHEQPHHKLFGIPVEIVEP